MTAIITTDMRVKNANQFLNTCATDSVYFYVGMTQPWGNSDTDIITPEDSWSDQQLVWQRMFGLKRFEGSDVAHGAPRYDWSSGTIYAEYDDEDSTLSTKRYYVINSDLNVYKCLKAGSGPSLIKPTGTSSAVNAMEADGYIWKYMFTLSGIQTSKYLTYQFLPVTTLTADDGSAQWTVQQNAIPGAIHNIKVVSGGSNYTTATVSITGNGTGQNNATATAQAVITNGEITDIIVTDIGQDYNYATVTITGDGVNATARAIISPPGGHGSDPVTELGGFYTIANVQLDGLDNGDILVDNEYRQLGMVLNPYNNGTTTIATAETLRATYQITYSNLTGGTFAADDIITGSINGSQIAIDYVDVTNSALYFHLEEGVTGYGPDLQVGETITSSNGLITADVATINPPEVEPFSGKVLYIENRSPVSRSADQIEDVKLILEF